MLAFAPDAIDIAPEVLSSVSAVPTIRGYRTPPGGVDIGGAQFSGTPAGAATLTGLNGSTRTFVGTDTYLYEYTSGTWTDRSRAGNYSLGSSRWQFAQFGDTELAIAKTAVLQSSSTGAFADVANAPKAACMEVVAGFVMLADTDDSGLGITGGPNADQGHRWWCSQLFNATGSWAPAASTQATTGLLVETQGSIKALKRIGNDCAAYKPTSIYIGRYVGPPAVWQWQAVSTDVGTSAPNSVCAVGNRHFFVGDADIYMFDGAQTQPIGASIKEWFFGRLNRAWVSNIRSLHDKSAKLVYWFYPSGADSTLNSVLCYHYDTQRWGAFDLTVKDVVETITGSITYDSLGNSYSTYDDLPAIPYDSPFWSASTTVLAYVSSSNYLTSLSGSAASMNLVTGWYGDENAIQLCRRVRPRMRSAPTSGTIRHEYRDELGGSIALAGTSDLDRGRFDVLWAARYHRFNLTLNGGCEIEAVQPEMVVQGLE